MFEVNM